MSYEPVEKGLECDLGMYSMEMAARRIDELGGRRRWKYTLFVSTENERYAGRVLKEIGASTLYNPLAPYINLDTDMKLKASEWFLSGIDEFGDGSEVRVGSKGC